MKTVLAALLCIGVVLGGQMRLAAGATSPSAPEQAYMEWAWNFWNALDRRTGIIELAGGVATLEVPNGFYYLAPQDARTVLEAVWGNPAGAEPLGLLLPADHTPFDRDAWAVRLGYAPDGYVTDTETGPIDSDGMLERMKASAAAESKSRVANGYPAIDQVEWVTKPRYDRANRTLCWAKSIRFVDVGDPALNHSTRVLGSKGVLMLDVIAGLGLTDLIKDHLGTVSAMARFNKGFRYEDFDPALDTVAVYRIDGLVAGRGETERSFLRFLVAFAKTLCVFALVGVAAVLIRLLNRKRFDAPPSEALPHPAKGTPHPIPAPEEAI